MGSWKYTEEELDAYFHGSKSGPRGGASGTGNQNGARRQPKGMRGFFHRKFSDPRKAQAALYVSIIAALMLLGTLVLGVYLLLVSDDLPSFSQLDNPRLAHATVAYTSDGEELAHYFLKQNRSWVAYENISPHVINALIATEDQRFYDHWGVDMQGIAAAGFDAIFRFDLRGASTITQQLARNLYRQQIGYDVNVGRKLKEMITAVQLERRYTKPEILEMYLNTVEYVYSAYGIQSAAKTFFGKNAADLDVAESATLVGMLQNPSLYNPVRFPENTQRRRNVVLAQMVKRGDISDDLFDSLRGSPVALDFTSADVRESMAPYFAMAVQEWLLRWAEENDIENIYEDGLVVYTTLDSRLQKMAQSSVSEQMPLLQKVVDYEWSRTGRPHGTTLEAYESVSGYEPFSYFWRSRRNVVNSFIRESQRFKNLRAAGVDADDALEQLWENEEFMDSVKTAKTRIEAGLLSIDPRNGYVRAWVGGRDLKVEWYDHVNDAARQPGSTFKPFVYATAIDNGYSPNYQLPDSSFTWVNPETGVVWQPGNFGEASGDMITLREALATSNNLVTARVITQLVNAQAVARYARAMGIKSPLDPVPALGLGTSDVTLLELTAAYSTLANGGLAYEPTIVTRIEDRRGNVLYEANPAPEEALSQETAYTVVDMLRGAVNFGNGTAIRIRTSYGLGAYDLAAKTGTTQNAADGWFVLMHPELVTGAWVGWNDRRIHFRDTWWGQGAHNALFLVGDYFRQISNSGETGISLSERFPTPSYGFDPYGAEPTESRPVREERRPRGDDDRDRDRGRERERVGW